MTSILLLEDDPNLATSLLKYLKRQAYEVTWVKNGEEALDASYDNPYDLYLFDINVPLLNGIDLLQSLREAGDTTPTIIISALIDITSMSRGFRAGADDYVKKPFDIEELLVRIQAKTSSHLDEIHYREFTLLVQEQQIYYRSQALDLSLIQKRIFVSLLQNYPNPVTKEEMLLLLDKPTDLALRVHISKLKKKLDIELVNIRGVGYKII